MEIWAKTYPSRLESISTKTTKLQKKIVRAISFSDPRDHTRPIFENLSILPIDNLNTEAIALFHLNFSQKHFPITFKDFSSQIISITKKPGSHSKSTKNRHVRIIKNILSDLKDVKFGTSFPYSSKTQNHLIFPRKGLKNIMIY